MQLKLIRNDMARSKSITLIVTLLIAAAAMLVSLAAMLAVHLWGSIDNLMTQARTPHFMQMHAGPVDRERLTRFAEGHDHVEKFQLSEFLNLDGAQMVLGGRSLADSVQDNGLTVQNKSFDYLLDMDGHVIRATEGELYVPVAYMKEGRANLGDSADIHGRTFTVAGFLRDSQMNAALASSKRFLVSDADYAAMKPYGNVEYLIQFRLNQPSETGAFEADYAAAGLEANGPTLTYPLFRMLNAMSDGVMIAVILLVSALVVAASLMCIRFALLAKIEEDYREFGVMKAIGLPLSDIRRMYLAKYAAIAAAGGLAGFGLSLAFRGQLLAGIRLYMGESGNGTAALLAGAAGIAGVCLSILLFVHIVLRRFKKLSPAQALRSGAAPERAGAGRFTLSGSGLPGTNVWMGVKDVLSRTRLYVTMLAVLVISAFIIIVPHNLYTTLSSEGFAAYMGVGKSDLRLDIQQTGDIPGKSAQIAAEMEDDAEITRHVVLTTRTYTARMTDGSEERLKIELGDHSVFPVKYAEGQAPSSDGELALSVLNAGELGMAVGDRLTLVIAGNERTLTVSGLYSDVTNGGKTAKAIFEDHSPDVMWTVIGAEVADRSLTAAKVADYAKRFPYAKVSALDAFIDQTFGATVKAVRLAANASVGVALALMVLVTLLFMKLLVVKDRYSISVMRALGFTHADISLQYGSRSGLVLIAGAVIGTLLANTAGEALAGGVISSFGVSAFTFETDRLAAYLFSPVLMAACVLLATMFGTSGARHIQISAHLKE